MELFANLGRRWDGYYEANIRKPASIFKLLIIINTNINY